MWSHTMCSLHLTNHVPVLNNARRRERYDGTTVVAKSFILNINNKQVKTSNLEKMNLKVLQSFENLNKLKRRSVRKNSNKILELKNLIPTLEIHFGTMQLGKKEIQF